MQGASHWPVKQFYLLHPKVEAIGASSHGKWVILPVSLKSSLISHPFQSPTASDATWKQQRITQHKQYLSLQRAHSSCVLHLSTQIHISLAYPLPQILFICLVPPLSLFSCGSMIKGSPRWAMFAHWKAPLLPSLKLCSHWEVLLTDAYW